VGELTASSENPAGPDAVVVGDALLDGDAVADALGLAEEVGEEVSEEVGEDWVGLGLGGWSSAQPASASDIKVSTVTVLATRNLPMSTSCSRRYRGAPSGTGRLAHPTPHDPKSPVRGAAASGILGA